MLQYEIIR